MKREMPFLKESSLRRIENSDQIGACDTLGYTELISSLKEGTLTLYIRLDGQRSSGLGI